MTKQDLKTGMLVQTRNKQIWFVFEQTLLHQEGQDVFGWNTLKDCNDNILMLPEEGDKDYDIIKVTRVLVEHELCSWTQETVDKYLLWSRESGFKETKTEEKSLRKEEFDIETSTWTETN